MVKLIKRNMSKRGKKSVKKRSKKAGTPGMAYIPQEFAKKNIDNKSITIKYYPTLTEYNNAKEAFTSAKNPSNEELEEWMRKNKPISTVKYYPTQDAYEAAKQEYSNKHTPEELEQWRKENKGPISGNLTKLFRGFSSGGKRRRTRKSKKSRKSRRKMTKRRRH